MPLKINAKAPDFSLKDDQNNDFSLSRNLKGQPAIIYFYPKDFTPGCTKEACEFRDHFSYFRNLDLAVIGISQDSVTSHQKFKKEYRLPFTLLADTNSTVSRLYKATVPILNLTRRITYLLDSNHKVKAVYENMFGAEKHIEEMVKTVKGAGIR
jgi:peroxiredoxin Q/BCP